MKLFDAVIFLIVAMASGCGTTVQSDLAPVVGSERSVLVQPSRASVPVLDGSGKFVAWRDLDLPQTRGWSGRLNLPGIGGAVQLPNYATPPETSAAKHLSPPKDYALVYFVRPKRAFADNRSLIAVNEGIGEDIVIGPDSFHVEALPAGVTRIEVYAPVVFMLKKRRLSYSREVSLNSDTAYFFRSLIRDSTGPAKTLLFEQISEEEGRRLLQQCRLSRTHFVQAE